MNKIEKITVASIIGWFFIHLIIFITTKIDPCGFERPLEHFWPIDGGIISYVYDLSEFLIYAATPLIFYTTYKILSIFSKKIPPPPEKLKQ